MMKISRTLQKVAKKDGNRSPVSKVIIKLKDSKEFNYLVDVSRA
jgi:hypothetical protein